MVFIFATTYFSTQVLHCQNGNKNSIVNTHRHTHTQIQLKICIERFVRKKWILIYMYRKREKKINKQKLWAKLIEMETFQSFRWGFCGTFRIFNRESPLSRFIFKWKWLVKTRKFHWNNRKMLSLSNNRPSDINRTTTKNKKKKIQNRMKKKSSQKMVKKKN